MTFDEIVLSPEKEPTKDKLWLRPKDGLFELLIYNNGWEPIVGTKIPKIQQGKYVKVIPNRIAGVHLDLVKDLSKHPTIASILERLDALESS